MNGPSDFYILNGNSHHCVCGALWTDSDGGPCHTKCDTCGETTVDGEPCGCALVGIPLKLLKRVEQILLQGHNDPEFKQLHEAIDEGLA